MCSESKASDYPCYTLCAVVLRESIILFIPHLRFGRNEKGIAFMTYKMAFLDIDGTISERDNLVRPRVAAAVRGLCARGIPVCLSTGRNFAHVLPILDALGVDIPVSTVDSAMVYAGRSGDVLFANTLSSEAQHEICELAAQHAVYIEAVTDTQYYKCIHGAPSFDYGMWNDTSMVQYVDACKDLRSLPPYIWEYIFGGSTAEIAALRRAIAVRCGDAVGMRDDLWDGYLFAGAKGLNKTLGMRQLCTAAGVALSEIVAIGDGLNDLDFLACAGLGVAMGGSDARVLAVADCVTGTIHEDGAAIALEMYFGV